jgi:DNA-directed RNA polymerase subunit N (RpoN/RPB10)
MKIFKFVFKNLKMLFPIRCITCGKVINQYYQMYLNLIENGKTIKDALDSLNITRYCCRRMFMCHNKDTFDYISQFDKTDFPFIQDKFEKKTNVDENANNLPQEIKNSDSENSDNEIPDEDNFDFNEDIVIEEDFDD